MTREEVATRSRRGRITLTWALSNVVIGYLAAYPLLAVVVYSYYVRAKLWGTVSSPFRAGEADVPLLFILATGIPLAIVAVLVNRALRRQLELQGWPAVAFRVATVIVLLAPFSYFALADLTVSQMLGKGLIW